VKDKNVRMIKSLSDCHQSAAVEGGREASRKKFKKKTPTGVGGSERESWKKRVKEQGWNVPAKTGKGNKSNRKNSPEREEIIQSVLRKEGPHVRSAKV